MVAANMAVGPQGAQGPQGAPADGAAPPAQVQAKMDRSFVPDTPDQALWVVIRNSTNALSYEKYAAFIEPIMGFKPPQRAVSTFNAINNRVRLPFPDAEPYRLLEV